MYLYIPVKQTLTAPELGRYTTFAVSVYQLTETGSRLIASVPDVSTDEAVVSVLACRCTAGQLDPAQLLDVVEDFI